MEARDPQIFGIINLSVVDAYIQNTMEALNLL
jgi:hypothetical protein